MTNPYPGYPLQSLSRTLVGILSGVEKKCASFIIHLLPLIRDAFSISIPEGISNKIGIVLLPACPIKAISG